MTNKQTILITGATGSIGGGAAVALAKRGAGVVLLGRKLLYDLPRETAEIMQQAGDTTLACLYRPTQTKARQHL